MKANILVVDDDPTIRATIQGGFDGQDYRVFCAESGQEGIKLFQVEQIDLAILDYSLPDTCGADLFHQLRAIKRDLPVIFLTAHSRLETAVRLMKGGVRDYLVKPFGLRELAERTRAVLLPADQKQSNHPGRPVTSAAWSPGDYIFSNTEAMRAVDAHIRNLPRYPDTTVLITGPTGTGKSAVARRIHELTWGPKGAPFVEIDCSTIPRELCESELFGHEKGSFIGAHRSQPGLFEAAGKGTAFLDEIGELDLALQAKFLRVLEARQFKRVGSHTTLPMCARIIAATNRSLPDLVRDGRFRQDLYFRFNVFELWMPPLKDRREDIATLSQHFLEYYAAHYKKVMEGFTPEALEFLGNYDFPGNIRELRNMVERAVISSNSPRIHCPQLESLRRPAPYASERMAATGAYSPPVSIQATPPPLPGMASSFNLAGLEREKLLEAMTRCNGNKSHAALMVGLSRTAFHRRLKKYQ